MGCSGDVFCVSEKHRPQARIWAHRLPLALSLGTVMRWKTQPLGRWAPGVCTDAPTSNDIGAEVALSDAAEAADIFDTMVQ